jgi:hypothetical protein
MLIATVVIIVSCNTSSNTITFTISAPGLNKGEDGYIEATGVLTWGFKDLLKTSESVMKVDAGTSVTAYRELLTVTEWRYGTGLFNQIAAYTEEMQYFTLSDFDDPVPSFDTNDQYYEKITNTFTWRNNLFQENDLLQEMTETFEGNLINKIKYDYNPDNTLKAERWSSDGVIFEKAWWYKYGDKNFPLLPVEIRNFEAVSNISSDYDYANDPNNYAQGPTSMNDLKFTYTPTSDNRMAVIIGESGDAWASSWTYGSKIINHYDSSGRVSRIDFYFWESDKWEHSVQIDITYSGNVSSFLIETTFFRPWADFFPF